jgi:hypothetical protein
METANGTPEKDTSRRHDDLCCQNEQGSLEQSRGIGEINRSGEQSGSAQVNSQRTNSPNWKLYTIRDTTAGKILERIESLEARHIKYVRAHQSRLNARLEESVSEEEAFIKEANQIKSDIYHLAVAQQQANGNGHIN